VNGAKRAGGSQLGATFEIINTMTPIYDVYFVYTGLVVRGGANARSGQHGVGVAGAAGPGGRLSGRGGVPRLFHGMSICGY
jgi:hypothetical protein